jgi:hypothetical protein
MSTQSPSTEFAKAQIERWRDRGTRSVEGAQMMAALFV